MSAKYGYAHSTPMPQVVITALKEQLKAQIESRRMPGMSG